MNALERRIASLVEANGPMPVSDYMALCLLDPEHGYYTRRDPFGTDGDFTTAPEVSQMFGELVAAWLANAWRAMGEPRDAIVVEIGPGRGTLMLDMARTLRRLAPSLASRLHLIEASPRLRDVQRKWLADGGHSATWHEGIETLPKVPTLMVANELFDALPTRQFVAVQGRWRERCIVLRDGKLAFGIGAGTLPEPVGGAPEGSIREVAPARESLMEAMARELAAHDGALLAIDYGHWGGSDALGDTLQAVRAHAYANPLAEPGMADLTTHVDFGALAASAKAGGAHIVGRSTQGEFLLGMGLLERAGALGAAMNEAGRDEVREAVERLAAPDQMGDLFKVLAVSGRVRTLPPFGG